MGKKIERALELVKRGVDVNDAANVCAWNYEEYLLIWDAIEEAGLA